MIAPSSLRSWDASSSPASSRAGSRRRRSASTASRSTSNTCASTDMSYQTIQLEINERDARLTLNRPEKLNSFNVAMHGEVRDALERVKAQKSVRVLVLTGA